jgi:heme/copper-type cytochrome/quinol oxidase subunit 2
MANLKNYQINFQEPATLIMDGIIDLHHDIMAFLVLISIFVIYMLVRIIYFFGAGIDDYRSNYNHNSPLEVI